MNTAATPTDLPSRPPGALGRPRSVGLRRFRENVILGLLIACGVFTVVVTAVIVYILLSETWFFFTHEMQDVQGDHVRVSLGDFFLDTKWSPTSTGNRHFGIWSLVVGTAQVAVVAMAVALPLGLVTAIWLSEYAKPRVRSFVKPVLEIIAGIPTVVFGFFALTVITSFLRFDFLKVQAVDQAGQALMDQAGHAIMVPWNPFGFSIYNALSAGIAVGIMCIPIVTSLSEDALRAVPRALREAAYGLGCSRFEAATKVVVPAALSGIIAAFILAIARAVGETMIVAMAAGALAPNPAEFYNVTQDTQTMTGYLVMIFLGDIQHGGVEYQSSYAVASTLFVMTLGLTVLGGAIRRRFQQVYD